MTHAYEEKTIESQSPSGRIGAPESRGEADAVPEEPALELEPTIVLGRE